MLRKSVGVCGLLVVIGLSCQSAQGGDHGSSARRSHEEPDEIILEPKSHSSSLKYELAGVSTATAFRTSASGSAHRRSSREGGTPTGDAPRREHKRLTLFHINSKFGDIAVEPVIGKVNGAQFSIGF